MEVFLISNASWQEKSKAACWCVGDSCGPWLLVIKLNATQAPCSITPHRSSCPRWTAASYWQLCGTEIMLCNVNFILHLHQYFKLKWQIFTKNIKLWNNSLTILGHKVNSHTNYQNTKKKKKFSFSLRHYLHSILNNAIDVWQQTHEGTTQNNVRTKKKCKHPIPNSQSFVQTLVYRLHPLSMELQGNNREEMSEILEQMSCFQCI